MSLQFHYVELIIDSCTGRAMKSNGGATSRSMLQCLQRNFGTSHMSPSPHLAMVRFPRTSKISKKRACLMMTTNLLVAENSASRETVRSAPAEVSIDLGHAATHLVPSTQSDPPSLSPFRKLEVGEVKRIHRPER